MHEELPVPIRIPNHKKCISIHVVRLNFGVIVLKYDLHESPVSSVDQRSPNLWRSFERPAGEIKRVNPLQLVLVRKPQWCFRRRVRDPIERGSSFSIDHHRRLVLQDVHLRHIDRSVSERSLRIRPRRASTQIPPDNTRRKEVRRQCRVTTWILPLQTNLIDLA